MEITAERELPAGHEAPPLGKTLKERMMPQGTARPQMIEPDLNGGENPLAGLFQYETPDGWKEAAPTQMRLVNMRFGEGDAGECYLTVLSGGGGGLLANVGRWYGQMSEPAPSAEEVDALPRALLLNRSAVVVDLSGTFKGMGGPAKEDYRLVGRILPEQQSGDSSFSMFLKMTGPKAVVDANFEKFEQFCQSLAPKVPGE